jgi:ABC-type glycerol-3-phosphate transport system substrate-binding protein
MLAVSHARVPAMRRWTSAGGPHVGFVALPHRPDFPPATVLIASGYAVPALGPRRKLAVELVAALTDSFAGRMRGEAGLELPAMPSVAGQLAARDTLGWEATFLRAAEHGRLPWSARIGGWEAIEAALPDLLDRIVVGGDDADAVARDMARRLDRLLGTAR